MGRFFESAWVIAACSACLGIAVIGVGCGGESTGDFRGTRVEGTEPGDCEDGADNDADGLFDCADPGCAPSPVCGGGAGGASGTGGAGGTAGAGGVGGRILCADVDCDDQNECTTDACDPVDGQCNSIDVFDGTSCDFGGLPGVCAARACEDAMLCADVDCDDGNDCTADTCDPSDGMCSNDPVTNGTSCDFGGLPGVCTVGTCEDAMLCATVDCDDGNACTADTCDPMDGSCNYTNVTDGSACDFGGLPGVCEADECVKPRSWGTPVLIETDDIGQAPYPKVAFDPNGNAIAVWGREDGVWANRFTPTGGWESAMLISPAIWGEKPRIAVDPNGNAMAVWVQRDVVGIDIWANRYTPSGGWGVPELVDSDTGEAGRPRVAFDPDGNAIAVWDQEGSGGVWNIWSNRYTPSGGWGTAELIENNDPGSAFEPRVAFDPNGNAIAVWHQYDGVLNNIWSNRYTPSGGWGTAELVELDDKQNAADAELVVDPNGNATAVWYQLGSFWANRHTPSGGWGSPERIGGGNNMQMASDPDGNIIVVWNGGAVRYTPGGGWGTAEPISPQNRPQVAFDGKGNAIVVWTIRDRTYDVWACRYTPRGGWGAPVLIETDDTGDAFWPEVALDANGNAITVWFQTEFSRWNVWANRFE